MIADRIKSKILENALSLESFGLRNLAWERELGMNLIKSLMLNDIGILGGDVYTIVSNKLIPTYDNWYCKSKDDESKEEFFLRSKQVSLDYIKNYFINESEKILFSILFTEIID